MVLFSRMKKPETITIIQITNNNATVYGLGSDQQIYQWNILDCQWHLYSLEKDTGGTEQV